MIFVVGNSRSGTTLMGRILGQHPKVFTFGELHFFGQYVAPPFTAACEQKTAETLAATLYCLQREGYRTHGHPRRFRKEASRFLAGLPHTPSTAGDLFEAFLSHITAENGKTLPCDQTPRNVFYLSEILDLYPNARILNMIRDPRDVLLSQKKKWNRRFLGGTDLPLKETVRDWMNYHPLPISYLWRAAVTAADRFAQHDRVMSVYFEELVQHPAATLTRLCTFLGIAYTAKMLEVPHVGSSVTADAPHRFGLNPNAAHRWQQGGLRPVEIYLNQKITAPLMETHTYPRIPVKPTVSQLLGTLFTAPLKCGGAFLLNLDRMKHIRHSLKRRIGYR